MMDFGLSALFIDDIDHFVRSTIGLPNEAKETSPVDFMRSSAVGLSDEIKETNPTNEVSPSLKIFKNYIFQFDSLTLCFLCSPK